MKIKSVIITMLCLIIFQAPCIAADECGGVVIQFYDEEMLLQDINSKAGNAGEPQKPIVQNNNQEGKTIGMEVPRSIKYNTAIMKEGADLYRSGKYLEAAAVFETALERYRQDGFEEGEIAVLGNLYLIYSRLGDEEEASKYLEAYRKKRRKKTGSLILITPEESLMQEAPSWSTPAVASLPREPARGTEQTMLAIPESTPSGPEIRLISPESENITHSPLKILVKFLPREGAQIDISTLKVELLKLITINITDRLKEYASINGINVEKAELPSGSYKIRVSLSDSKGGTTSKVFVLKVQ